ncbi:Peroxidase 4 [Linum grandiflorum]
MDPLNTTFCLILLLAVLSSAAATGSLSPEYYLKTCPKAPAIVKAGVAAALKNETRMGASLLRLHFHDCFVNGCDASILLDDNATFVGEKTASPNINSTRGFEVIDKIKAQVEESCPGIVSCADILALAAMDSVVYLGGPWWEVGLGRRDSITASKEAAEVSLPQPTFNLSDLAGNFWAHGLSLRDMVALSGIDHSATRAHTIGLARCTTFRDHIYKDTDIDPPFAKWLRKICPRIGDDDVLTPLDYRTPLYFDNSYYVNLVNERGLLHSDQELYDDSPSAASIVRIYVDHSTVFFDDFSKGMIKMGEIMPLTGNEGEIRKNCRKAN